MLIAALAAATAAAETEVAHDPLRPFLVAGIAFAVFLPLGIVAWSYRDVANRHSDRTGGNGHDSHTAGH